jgi:tape measure domain-containing protein
VAESLGSAVLTLSVDDAAYQAGLLRAKQSADKTLNSIKGPNLGGGLFADINGEVGALKGGLTAGALAATGLAVAVGAIGVSLVQAAGNAQKLTAAFTGLTGSAAAAAQLRQELFTLSKATPFRNEELLRAAQRFLAVGVEADKLGGTINRIGALAAQSGQSLERVGLIYAQVFAKGRLQGEENLQFLEAGIDLNRQLAVVTGLSGAALQDAMSKGKISVNDVNAAIVLATGNMQALTGAGKSVSVQFNNIGDNVQQVFLGFAQAVSPALAAAFDVINKGFDRLFPSLESITKFFQPLTSEAEKLAKLLEKNPRVVEALALAFESLLSTGITPVVEGIANINKGLEVQPTGLIDSITELELKLRRAAFTASGLVKIITAPARLGGLLSGEAREQLFAGLADIQKALNAKEIDVPINVKPNVQDIGNVAGDLSTKTQGLKNALSAGADALKKAAQESADKFIEASRQLLDARIKLGSLQANTGALNQFLTPEEQFKSTREAIVRLGPDLEAGIARATKLLNIPTGQANERFQGLRDIFAQAKQGIFASQAGFDRLAGFLSDVSARQDAVTGVNEAQESVNAINKELVGVNTSLRDQVAALVQKAWNVQVNVQGGQATAYGDLVNTALASA